jgi:hypothetical protein
VLTLGGLVTLLGFLLVCAVIIFALWLVRTYMPAPWQTPTLVVVVILALVFLIYSFWPGAAAIRIGK